MQKGSWCKIKKNEEKKSFQNWQRDIQALYFYIKTFFPKVVA